MPFFKLLFSLPGIAMMVGTILAIVMVGFTGVSIYHGAYITGVIFFLCTAIFFSVAYAGFRLQRALDTATKLARTIVNTNMKDVSVELINRVKKV